MMYTDDKGNLISTTDLTDQYSGGLTPYISPYSLPTEPVKEYAAPISFINELEQQNFSYNYSGQVVDAETGEPVPYATVVLFSGPTQLVTGTADAKGIFTFITNQAADKTRISAVGYGTNDFVNDQGSTFELIREIPTQEEVTITTTKKKNYAWVLLLLIPLVLMQKKKGIKSVGELKSTNVWPYVLIAAALLGWNVINKILQRLGIFTGPGSQAVEQQQINPGSAWKPSFYKNSPSGSLLLHEADAAKLSHDIFNSFGIVQDDWERILGVFSQLQTKSQVSFLADVFNKQSFSSWFGITNVTGLDLLTFLTNGGGLFPWDGLSDAHLKTITDLVNRLPDYKI